MLTYKKLYKDFVTPESSGNKIGLFRIINSIFGAFIVSYLGMCVFAIAFTKNTQEAVVVSLFFNTLVWASTSLWLSLAPSKLSSFLRVLIPSCIFSLILLLHFKV